MSLNSTTTMSMSESDPINVPLDVAVDAPQLQAPEPPRHHFMAQHCRIVFSNFVFPNPITWTPTRQEQAIFNETCDRADRYSQTAYKQWVNGLFLNSVYNLGKYRSPFSMVTAWGIPILLAADLAAQSVPVWQGYREIRMLPRAESDFNQRGYRFRHFALARLFSVSSDSTCDVTIASESDGMAVAQDEATAAATATTWRRWGTRWGKLNEQA